MKKRLIKFLTLILSVIIGAAGLFGCNIVTDNTERDLNQVVATVNVNREENVYKKDLVMAYMNGGYYYVQYYGYDVATVYNMILDELVNNRIMVQVAYEEFEKTSVVDGTKEQYSPERYLTPDEIADVKYDTYKSINDLLDGYSENKSDTEKKDTLIFDVRTVPTDATNKEKELTTAEKNDYITKGFDITSNEYRRAAFNKVITLLKGNGLLGDDYSGSIETTDYFNRVLKNNFESKIIEKYEDAIKQKIIDDLDYNALKTSYNDKLKTQREWSNSEFVSALSSATKTSPILYSKDGTYGYVYNLLLGVNDYQSKKIEELKEERDHNHETEDWYAGQRKSVLAGTIAKDLRSSWILSGYDFDFASKKFTGDYTFAKDENNSLPFQGTVTKLRDADDEKNLSAVYKIDSVKTFGLDEFISFINTDYLYKDISLNTIDISSYDKLNSNDIYKAYKPTAKPVEYDAKINELLFAFSTDSGSLNTYKGYVIKPENTEYVKTFGEAGKALLEEGGSSYMVVASDYGYHFMFFSEVWTANKEYATLDAYLDTLDIDKGTATTWEDYFKAQKAKDKWEKFEEENNFLYFLANELISAKLSDATTRNKTNMVTEYRYGEHKDSTVIYRDRFSDLLG